MDSKTQLTVDIIFKVAQGKIDSVAIFETPFGTSKSPKGTKIVDKYACGSPGRPAYARYDTTRCHNFTSTNDLSTVLWALYFAFGKTSGTTVYQGLSASLLRRFLGRQRTINNATKLLNRSRRTIERYLNRYQNLGIKFVIHGNVGKSPANKIHDELRRKVQALIKQKYYDVNLHHLAELLSANENI